jgi:hypothetical protein
MVEQLIGVLLWSRDVAHKEHWKTKSYSHHKTLNEFYDSVIELTDDLVEMWQGRYDLMGEIPTLEETVGNPLDSLTGHLELIEKLRYMVIDKEQTALQNKIDEIVGLYLSTMYKLKNLK